MAMNMAIADLLDPVTPQGGPVHFARFDRWSQGRTLYGGAAALIAYTAAIRAYPDLPPLRAAQIAFVAPTEVDSELRTEIVRQGRNVTQLRSEIWSASGCALSAFFLFGAEREPNAKFCAETPPDWPAPPEEFERLPSPGHMHFIAQFDIRRAQDERGPGAPLVRRWVRFEGETGLDPVSEVILMGDVLPPGAMRAMRRRGPISSINWSFNLLEPEPVTRDGWYLLETHSQHADHGYSSERLRMWNTDGRQILDGMQSAAIFG